MPSKTRTTRSTKASKENIDLESKNEVKKSLKSVKQTRKPLADKTNSASDDNEPTEVSKKVADKSKKLTSKPVVNGLEINNNGRPRRDRRLPSRFIENPVLINLSLSKENVSPAKKNSLADNTFKTPEKVHDSSVISFRPKRVIRLPSKFEDHTISPNKFVPVQPCFASTPLAQNKTSSKINTNHLKNEKTDKNVLKENKEILFDGDQKSSSCKKDISKRKPLRNKALIKAVSTKSRDEQILFIKPSSNGEICFEKEFHVELNNYSSTKSAGTRNNNKSTEIYPTRNSKQQSPKKDENVLGTFKDSERKLAAANFSFRLLEEKNPLKIANHQDIYEFTFDPNEEPKPQKKKRKRVVKKKLPEPKLVVFKNTYDKNVSQALKNLKQFVKTNKKERNQEQIKSTQKVQKNHQQKQVSLNKNEQKTSNLNVPSESHTNTRPSRKGATNAVVAKNQHHSMQLEEIAADIHVSMNHNNDINYSPVSSPRPTDAIASVHEQGSLLHPQANDHSSLREETSFFKDQPVASSSMNISSRSTRMPHASPWRVDFENLPIKWHVNSRIKPDMTPAMETSYVNFNDNHKKEHVYTNLVPSNDEPLPEIEKEPPKLKQTSIADFIKEVAERSITKKKRGRSVTPTRSITPVRNNTMFDNHSVLSNKTPKELATPSKNTTYSNDNAENIIDSDDKENSKGRKRKNDSSPNLLAKTSRKDDGNVDNFFGFDDSGYDQENVVPNQRARSMRPRSRAVLKEINAQSGPTRATIKTKQTPGTKVVENLFEELKSSTETAAPTSNEKIMANIEQDESQSIHLFEDIETVHHQKANRKSYSKAKKVTFRQPSFDSNTQEEEGEAPATSEDEEDLSDLTFEMPAVKAKRTMKKKKITAKQKLFKKEEEEAEAWAAGFNSMCEDVDGYDLLVE